MSKRPGESIELDQNGFATFRFLVPGSSLPLVIEPAARDIGLDDPNNTYYGDGSEIEPSVLEEAP